MKLLFGILIALMLSCSSSGGDGYGDQKPTPPVPDSPKFVAVKPTIQRVCGKCHGVTQKSFNSESRWKSSQAKQKILSGEMPKDAVLSDEDKKTLLASFD